MTVVVLHHTGLSITASQVFAFGNNNDTALTVYNIIRSSSVVRNHENDCFYTYQHLTQKRWRMMSEFEMDVVLVRKVLIKAGHW